MMKEADFADLYTAHFRQVRGLCRQLLGSADRAEDAAQEAFIRAYRALASYDSAQSVGGS
jgi:DNA-directed RNA polymerase specialized sigma24 family protein